MGGKSNLRAGGKGTIKSKSEKPALSFVNLVQECKVIIGG